MANGRRNSRKAGAGRDPGGFVALPWSVLDSAAYADLSHPARSLLLEIARQFVRDNNGQLLASRAYLAKRGWKSARVIDKAKHELLAAGFIHETVKGHRPNRASWFAVTWYVLDRHPGYDAGAVELFERGAYRKNAPLSPTVGTRRVRIGPTVGTGVPPAVPSVGAMDAKKCTSTVPTVGHHLEKPSAAALEPVPA